MFNKLLIIGCGLIGSSILRASIKKKIAKKTIKTKENITIKFWTRRRKFAKEYLDAFIEEKILDLQNTDKISRDLMLSYSYLLLSRKDFKRGFDYFDYRLETNDFPKKNKYHYNIIKTLNKHKKIEINNSILIVIKNIYFGVIITCLSDWKFYFYYFLFN